MSAALPIAPFICETLHKTLHKTKKIFFKHPGKKTFSDRYILIFQEALFSPRTHTIFQETLSSPRTHTIFQETPMPRTHRHFPGRYPLSNRYFVNRSVAAFGLVYTFFYKKYVYKKPTYRIFKN